MKNIRSKFVKESLLDYENLANTLKENTTNAVKDLLGEAVRDTYAKILTEEDEDKEDDYEVEEVDDTNSDDADKADNESTEDDDVESPVESDSDSESEADLDTSDEEDGSTEVEEPVESEAPEEDGWAEFDKYKVSDDEYDFSNAEDDEIVKVYKLLKDDDQVLVNVDNDSKKVELKDNQTGAEYLLDLSSMNGGGAEPAIDDEFDDSIEADGELDYEDDNMNESRIYEVVLNEYDSHVGYTDNYQKKDVMSTPSNTEPGKNVNDWDAGVPKGSSKPWASKGSDKPFDKHVTEEEDMDDETVEEATNVGGFVQQNSVSKSHIPNSNGRKARNSSVAGAKTKGTADPRYSSATNESKMLKKVNKILKENEELKKALGKFKNVLQEAAVTNVNLGQIIKLISENSTTKDEKQEIIERFGKEAKTVEDSKSLYESISRELKKNNKMDINEDKQFTTNGSKMINEQQIYKSQDIMDSLDLMHRICK